MHSHAIYKDNPTLKYSGCVTAGIKPLNVTEITTFIFLNVVC